MFITHFEIIFPKSLMLKSNKITKEQGKQIKRKKPRIQDKQEMPKPFHHLSLPFKKTKTKTKQTLGDGQGNHNKRL